MKEDWGTALSEAAQQFLGAHQAFSAILMQKQQIKMQKEQLELDKKAAELARDKTMWEIGPMMATIAGQPISLPDVGKALNIDTSKYPTTRSQQPTSGQGVVPGRELTEPVDKPLMFQPMPDKDAKTSGVSLIDLPTAIQMTGVYKNLDPNFIMSLNTSYSKDLGAKQSEFDKALVEANKSAAEKGVTFGLPEIDLENAKYMVDTTYRNLEPGWIVQTASYFKATGEDDPKKLYDTIEQADKDLGAMKALLSGGENDPTKYSSDLIAKHTATARAQAGFTEMLSNITPQQKQQFDSLMKNLMRGSIDSLRASKTFDDDFKKNVISQLEMATPSDYYNQLVGAFYVVDDAVEKMRKSVPGSRTGSKTSQPLTQDEKDLAMLQLMAKNGFRFYNTIDLNNNIQFALSYMGKMSGK